MKINDFIIKKIDKLNIIIKSIINMDMIHKQPVFNVGMLGSVSDGKSTCVYQLTGTKTQRHSNEQVRNITIKPGYGNMKIWNTGDKLVSSNSETHIGGELVHHISFVDCPGHQELILAMLGNVKLMDGVIVVVSAAEPIESKPQLIQHLAAIKISGIDKIIVCMNKLDLVNRSVAMERYMDLKNLLSKYEITPNIIIPTSFNKKIGFEWLLKEMVENFYPDNSVDDKANFLISRTFDINKVGILYKKFTGGVLGGSLVSGSLEVGDEIEIRPGILYQKGNTVEVTPIITKIESIKTDKSSLDKIIPGGLMGIKTDIDPFYCKNDKLSGQVLGRPGTLPDIYQEFEMKYTLTEEFGSDWKPKTNDQISLQIGSINVLAKIKEFNKKVLKVEMSKPVCFSEDNLILITKKQFNIMRIVGYGEFKKGKKIKFV